MSLNLRPDTVLSILYKTKNELCKIFCITLNIITKTSIYHQSTLTLVITIHYLYKIFFCNSDIHILILWTVALDNIIHDVGEIKRGMELTRREFETHKHPVLQRFLEGAETKVSKVWMQPYMCSQNQLFNVITKKKFSYCLTRKRPKRRTKQSWNISVKLRRSCLPKCSFPWLTGFWNPTWRQKKI